MNNDDTPWQSPSATPDDGASATSWSSPDAQPGSHPDASPQSPSGSQPASHPAFGSYGVAPAGSLDSPHPGAGTTTPAPVHASPTGHVAGTGSTTYPAAQPSSSQYGAPPPLHTMGWSFTPKPGIIPLRPLSIGEIISGAFDAMRANPKSMFLPSLIIMSVMGVISALATFSMTRSLDDLFFALETSTAEESPDFDTLSDFSPFSLIIGNIGTTLIQTIATAILTGLLIVAVSRSVLGRMATPSDVWARTKSRVWALIGQSFLTSFILMGFLTISIFISVGLVWLLWTLTSDSSIVTLFIVLTFIVLTLLIVSVSAMLWVRMSMAPAVLILENTGVISAIKRSWQLTRGSFWRVLGILLLSTFIVSTVSGMVGGALGSIIGFVGVMVGMVSLFTAISVVLSSIISAFVLPFSAAVIALTYIDLRMRREGLDVELRQATSARLTTTS